MIYENENFSGPSLHHILEWPFFKKNIVTWEVILKHYKSEIRGEFIRYKASKIVYEWKVHREIFILPQAKENSSQYLLLRTDISQKTVFRCPW